MSQKEIIESKKEIASNPNELAKNMVEDLQEAKGANREGIKDTLIKVNGKKVSLQSSLDDGFQKLRIMGVIK